MKKLLRMKIMLLLCALIAGSGSVWGDPITYNFSSIPTKGWSTNGGSQTINSISWTYSSCTHIQCDGSKIQIGSKNNPQTSAWTIQTPITNFGTGKAISAVSITSYTTETSATYDISVGGTSVKSGSLTTSSATYSATGLNVTSGNIVVTLTGSSTSKAMYLSNISVTYDDATTDPVISAADVEIDAEATAGEFTYTISNPVENTSLTASVTAGGTWLSNPVVDAANGKVTFTTTANEDEDNAREGTIHLVYGDNIATKDVTITQAKAPKKYTVTIDAPEGGTLAVKNGEAIVASGTRVAVGTTLTIVPTPDDTHKYKNWQYKEGTGSWNTRTTSYTYTINDNDVEFKANFDPTYAVNWSINGTISTSSVRYGKDEAITFPDNPSNIDGLTFVGWSATTISGVSSERPTFVTSATMGTEDVTYYAVYALRTPGNATTTVDELTATGLGMGGSYGNWSGKTFTSTAVYAGNGMKNSQSEIQIRAEQNSGIVSTASGGRVKKVVVNWSSDTTDGRTLDIYGKNSSYSAASDLYSSSSTTLGTKLGSIAKGTGTELEISGDYTYIGMRSNKNAMYINSISITWENGTPDSYSHYCTTITPATSNITLAAACTDGTKYYGTYSNETAFVVPEDMTVSGISYDASTNKLSLINYATGDVVKAGEGVLVVSTTSGDHTITLSSETGESLSGNLLIGTGNSGVTADDMADTDYYYYRLTMADGQPGFWWKSEGGAGFDLAANRAYLKLPKSASVRGFSFEDDATGISEIETMRNVESEDAYNLNGQRMTNPTKGLYIVNGRKVAIK